MIRFGAHAFTWEAVWNRTSAEEVFRQAAGAGLDLVEIPLLRPESFDTNHVNQLINSYQLEVSFSLGLPIDSRLPDFPDRAEKFLCRVVDIAVEVGVKMITGVLYGTLGELPGHRPEKAEYRVIAKSLQQVARYAAQGGIDLGLEPVNRYETYLINTVEQAIDLINLIDEDNVTPP